MPIAKLMILSLLVLGECFSRFETKTDYKFPSEYSLEQVKEIRLPGALQEVSGLEWVGKNELWAIEDESAIIYQIDPLTGEILQNSRFAKPRDIEDIVVINNVAWVLESNGKLYEVLNPFEETQEKIEHAFPIKEKRDFEAILHWEGSDYIWIFCKDCEWDDGRKKSSYYPFSLSKREFILDESKELKRKDFRNLPDMDEEEKYKMQPSGAAKHPLKDEIYIISSAGQWLAIFDLNFNLIDAFVLNPSLFRQPEGITFDPLGNLYISNEGAFGPGNILVFDVQ